MRRVVVAFLLVCCSVPALLAEDEAGTPPLEAAQALFASYVRLERSYDPTVADLYTDDAVIKNTRLYPNGQVREMELTGARYKELIRQAMPLAEKRGDRNTYSEVTYELREDGSVGITASRYSELKDYSSPMHILTAPGEDGRWRIVEELSVSRP